MFSFISWHKKVKLLKSIAHKHLSDKMVKQNQHEMMKNKFEFWRNYNTLVTQFEKEQNMVYAALKFRIVSLCRRTFRQWKLRASLSQNIGKIEQKLASATVGFSFFIIKTYSENIEDKNLELDCESHQNILIKYQADKIKNKLIGIFRKRSLFNSWKEISLTKRLDFPYNFYNNRLANRAFKAFILSLRRRWV